MDKISAEVHEILQKSMINRLHSDLIKALYHKEYGDLSVISRTIIWRVLEKGAKKLFTV
jgi:hypothetical protein